MIDELSFSPLFDFGVLFLLILSNISERAIRFINSILCLSFFLASFSDFFFYSINRQIYMNSSFSKFLLPSTKQTFIPLHDRDEKNVEFSSKS